MEGRVECVEERSWRDDNDKLADSLNHVNTGANTHNDRSAPYLTNRGRRSKG